MSTGRSGPAKHTIPIILAALGLLGVGPVDPGTEILVSGGGGSYAYIGGCGDRVRVDTQHTFISVNHGIRHTNYYVGGQGGYLVRRERWYSSYRGRFLDETVHLPITALRFGWSGDWSGIEGGGVYPAGTEANERKIMGTIGSWFGRRDGLFGCFSLGDRAPALDGLLTAGLGYHHRAFRPRYTISQGPGAELLMRIEADLRFGAFIWLGGGYQWSEKGSGVPTGRLTVTF